MGASHLRQLKEQLEEFELSPLAHQTFKDERAHLISLVDAYLVIRSALEAGERDLDAVDTANLLEEMRAAAAAVQGPRPILSVVSSRPVHPGRNSLMELAIVEERSPGEYAVSTAGTGEIRVVSSVEAALAGSDVILLDVHQDFSPLHAYIAGALAMVKSVIIVAASLETVPEYARGGAVYISDLGSALGLAEIALLYECLKRDLLVVQPWPGGIYYERSPSLNLSLSNPLPSALRQGVREGRCPREWLDARVAPSHR